MRLSFVIVLMLLLSSCTVESTTVSRDRAIAIAEESMRSAGYDSANFERQASSLNEEGGYYVVTFREIPDDDDLTRLPRSCGVWVSVQGDIMKDAYCTG